MSTLELPLDQEVRNFAKHLDAGFRSFVDAGNILARLVDRFGRDKAFAAIRARCPIPESALVGFLKLGRKELVPEVLVSSDPWARFVSRIPYDEQRAVVAARTVQVGRRCGSKVDFDEFRLEDLSERQCKIVFSDFGLRSPSEQIALLETPKRSNYLRTGAEDRKPLPTTQKAPHRPPVQPITLADPDDNDDDAPEASPEQEVLAELALAQASLLRVRELRGVNHHLDNLITGCLQAIGRLRSL